MRQNLWYGLVRAKKAKESGIAHGHNRDVTEVDFESLSRLFDHLHMHIAHLHHWAVR